MKERDHIRASPSHNILCKFRGLLFLEDVEHGCSISILIQDFVVRNYQLFLRIGLNGFPLILRLMELRIYHEELVLARSYKSHEVKPFREYLVGAESLTDNLCIVVLEGE